MRDHTQHGYIFDAFKSGGYLADHVTGIVDGNNKRTFEFRLRNARDKRRVDDHYAIA